MLDRLLGRRNEKIQKSTTVDSSREVVKQKNYYIQPGHAYLLIGGAQADIDTNCGSCGAGYLGPCQGSCEYCNSQRKVFYADMTDSQVINSIPETDLQKLTFYIPEGDSADFGYSTDVDVIVAEEVSTRDQFYANLVITKNFKGAYNSEIRTLILVDGGSATLYDNNWIGTLITGQNVSVKFGNNAQIEKLLKSSTLKLKAGEEFNIIETKIISTKSFAQEISKALQNK